MNERNLSYNEQKVLLAFTRSPCSGNPVFILEGTGGGSAGFPSCPWLCCTPSYSCTILQRAAEVTEHIFTPFTMFWLLPSWISSFWISESGDFRLYLDILFVECLGKTLLSSIQFPLGVHPTPGAAASPSALCLCQALQCCSQAPQQGHGLGHVAHTTAFTASNALLVCLSGKGKNEMHLFHGSLCSRATHAGVSGTQTEASHCCSPEPQWAQTDPAAPPNQAAGDEWVRAQPWPFPNHGPCVRT